MAGWSTLGQDGDFRGPRLGWADIVGGDGGGDIVIHHSTGTIEEPGHQKKDGASLGRAHAEQVGDSNQHLQDSNRRPCGPQADILSNRTERHHRS
jgi:hypothetical protein